MKKIVIDIDGTITGIDFLPVVNRYFGKNLSEKDLIAHDLQKVLGVSDQEWDEFYRENAEEWHNGCIARPLAADVINDLCRQGFTVSIVSARPKRLFSLTEEWLKRNQIYYSELVLVNSSNEKVSFLKEGGFDVLIEDHPKTASSFPAQKVIVMDAPYNQEIYGENLFRAFGWEDIQALI